MRLTQVKLSGFKSFVDPTSIEVPGQLVGVVGPNGCGKSNVIDAVRWVLGESSAKQLRGENMQDVIFAGSSSRKAVGRASVELVFDNSLGRVGGPWAQYGEISVKRVLSRDGDSSYYLNNQHVRRRDVTDIFLGTGLGPRAYSIIEQGMISRIITSRPEELRVFLEEAAGVSKYRERRRETELRLEDTRDNLARVGDITSELASQLERLGQQAEVAARYNDLQANLALTHNLLAFTRLREAEAAKNRAANEVGKAQVLLEAETAKLREAERGQEEMRDRHFKEADLLHSLQGTLYTANAEVAQLEQELQYLGENRRRMGAQLEGIAREAVEVEARIATANGDRDRWQSEIANARSAIATRESELEAVLARVPEAEAAAQKAAAAMRAAETELAAAEQEQGIEETRESHALKILGQFEARKNRLKQENMALVIPEPEMLERLARARESLAAQLHSLEASVATSEAQLPALDAERKTVLAQLQERTRELAGLEAALKALKGQQEKLEANTKLGGWIAQHGLDRAERLWQAIHVEAGWDDAVEAALGVKLNAVRLSGEEQLPALISDPPPANLAKIIERGAGEASSSSSHLKPLSSVVSSSRAGIAAYLKDALSPFFLLPAGENALDLARVLPAGGMLVSKAGHCFGRNGVVFHGPQSELHGVLQRQREIEALQEKLPGETRLRDALETQSKSLDIRVTEAQDEARRLRGEVAGIRQEDHEREVEYLKLSQSSQQAEARRGAIREELAAVEADEQKEQLEMQEAQHALEEGARRIEGITDRLMELEAAAKAAQGAFDAARAGIASAERAVQEAQFHERSCHERVSSSAQLVVSLAERIQALAANRDGVARELEALNEASVKDKLQAALQVRGEREKVLAEARVGVERITEELRAIEEQRLAVEQSLAPLRERITELRFKEQEQAIHAEQYRTQLQEAGANTEELAEQLEKKTRSSSLATEIARLNEEIAALGAVNLAALSELNASKERKDFLDAQALDLTQAIETLEAAIKRIDRETRDLLQGTFEAVNKNFQEMFPALFGGGQASLKLTGEEILDAGLQVTAQPPGKKNQSIQLLSGGEKALTAIALVFSLFQLNPAPFCLLDEVDAPLDDPNTERFCELVRQMSGRTQFLFITHNKITMELANQLIGVTMQEPGVSRIVEVDIEAALEFARKVAA